MSNNLLIPIQLTDTAVNKVKNLINNQHNPNLKLRVYVTNGGCNGLQYGFNLDDQVNDTDVILKIREVVIIIDSVSLQYIIGSSVDYVEGLEGSRFVVINPNAKIKCRCGLSFSI